MRKRIVLIMVTSCILLITGCGDSNRAENPTGADSQMVENAGQTDSEEKDIDVLSPLDGVIDHADFTLEAIMIQKDSPYEAVIDFEWRYGKLEPGRYRIVKTVMDVRETGNYTNYVFTAEFGI